VQDTGLPVSVEESGMSVIPEAVQAELEEGYEFVNQ